jgi:hypothetical protein
MPPAPRPERVQQETARQSGNKSQETTRDILKKRALVLSAEILTFLSDRDAVGRPRVSLIPQKDESSTQYADRLGKESKAYLDFETDTVQRYDATFSGRAIALVTEMKNAGLDVQRVWYKPNSSETIQRFALGLVAVAQKDGSD